MKLVNHFPILRWQLFFDIAVVLVIFSYNLPIVLSTHSVPLAAVICVFLGVCLPFLWRKKYPRIVFVITFIFIIIQYFCGIPIAAADVMLLLVLCSVATQLLWKHSIAPLIVTISWIPIATWNPFQAGYLNIGELGFIVLVVLLSYSWAITLRLYRQNIAGLKQRTIELQAAQEVREQMAKEEERKHIARELHDIVSHSLSSVVALSEGAVANIKSDPEQAAKAMRLAGDVSRSSLNEMRTMLNLLRAAKPETITPQPNATDLPQLINSARETGTSIDFRQKGTLEDLTPGLQLTIYRIIQEGLTNVRKHAAADTHVVVSIDRLTTKLVITMVNTHPLPSVEGSQGHGISGMRERVLAYGGELEATTKLAMKPPQFFLSATIPLGAHK